MANNNVEKMPSVTNHQKVKFKPQQNMTSPPTHTRTAKIKKTNDTKH